MATVVEGSPQGQTCLTPQSILLSNVTHYLCKGRIDLGLEPTSGHLMHVSECAQSLGHVQLFEPHGL